MCEISEMGAARIYDDPIKEFYHGRDIFVTGGSGLIGKALLEKLLRSCSGINRIFVLLRAFKGKEGNERLEEVKNSKIFDRLRAENPSVMSKLVAIPGDIAQLGLGISEESKKKMGYVSIIFHVAATVRFDEPLRRAILLNTRGTHEAIKFAMELEHLSRFVHVSTAYCYPYMSKLEEKVLPAKADWRTFIAMSEQFDDDILNALTHKILDEFPNTYTFTKHLAEQICKDYSNEVPISIMRPTIVHCCVEEPMPGWYEKLLGGMGMMTGASTGVVRAVYARPSCVMDFISLDACVKILILAVWWVDKNERNLCLPVFNVGGSHVRAHSVETIVKVHTEVIADYPPNKMIWVPEYSLTDNIVYYYLRVYLFHVLPAFFLDILIKLSGRKPFLMHAQRLSLSSQRALMFFMFTDYTFVTNWFIPVQKEVKNFADFRFDGLIKRSLYDAVFVSHMGCRRFLLKEDDSSLVQARKRYKIIKWVDFIICKGFWAWVTFYVFKQVTYVVENMFIG